jgi:putative membrane protein
VVKDKIAKISAGVKKLDAGAAQLQAGAWRLERTSYMPGTGRLTAGFATLAGKLNCRDPNTPRAVLGTELLADGT